MICLRKKFRLLLLLSFFYQPIIFADIEDQYRNQKGSGVCSYENSQFYSLNSDDRYCVSGGFWKNFYSSGSSYSEGVLNRSLKNVGLLGSNTITKYKIEGDDLVRYSCKGTLDAYDFDCIGPVSRDVLASRGGKVAKSSFDNKNINLNQIFNLKKSITITKEKEYLDSGITKFRKEDYSGAIDDFTNAIKINPNEAKLYGSRGIAKSRIGDYSGAIDDLTNAIKLNPNDAQLYSGRGIAKSSIGDYSGAIDDLTNAIKIDPNYFEAYSNRGTYKGRKGDYSGAIDDLTNAIKINPNEAQLYTNRGSFKGRKGDILGACEDFKIAIRLGNKDSEKWVSKNCKN